MNRLTQLWETEPSVSALFSGEDRLVVERLCELAGDEQPTRQVVLPLLVLAKSTRLNHVSLRLNEDDIATMLDDVLATPSSESAATAPSALITPSDVVSFFTNPPAGYEQIMWRSDVTTPVEAVATQRYRLHVGYLNETALFVAFLRYSAAELEIARALVDSASEPRNLLSNTQVDEILAALPEGRRSRAGDAAVQAALTRAVSVITGGPGTGKTTLVAGMLLALAQVARTTGQTFRIALSAPTAKAAVRMQEAIGNALQESDSSWEEIGEFLELDERTGSVHKLLGITPEHMRRPRELSHDLVIIDEVSMLELTLLALVLRQAHQAHVVLVGDPNQLASVNVGAALRDIVDIANDGLLAPVVHRLVTNHRSALAINTLAGVINVEEAPTSTNDPVVQINDLAASMPDVVRREVQPSPHTLDLVTSHAERLVDAAMSEDPVLALRTVSQLAVLCGTNRGPGSVAYWRNVVEEQLNLRYGTSSLRFRIGTPLLITENENSRGVDATQQLNNGDLGVVMGTNPVRVVFDGVDGPRWRLLRDIHQAEPAWSMTIHKSQGSEYRDVVVSLPSAGSPLLSRELFYTAVTRAKERVTVLGSDEALRQAIARTARRTSAMPERIRTLAAAESRRNGNEIGSFGD